MVTNKDIVDYDRRILDDRVKTLDKKLETHIVTGDIQHKAIMSLVEENKVAIANLTDIWTQTKGAVTFIKIVAATTASLAGIWAFLKDNIHWRG